MGENNIVIAKVCVGCVVVDDRDMGRSCKMGKDVRKLCVVGVGSIKRDEVRSV